MGFQMGQPETPVLPFQGFSPEMLAQMAAQGFRPPGAPGGAMGGGAPGFQMPQGDGGLGQGMAGLGAGLGAYKKAGGNPFMAAERTAGDRDMNGYGASPVDPMSGNPNAQPVEVFNPTGAVKGGGFFDFLTNGYKAVSDYINGR